MPLYDYLSPKLDFKCKFNHRQSFLYKGRLTCGADDSKILNRIITTNRIPNRKLDSKSNLEASQVPTKSCATEFIFSLWLLEHFRCGSNT